MSERAYCRGANSQNLLNYDQPITLRLMTGLKGEYVKVACPYFRDFSNFLSRVGAKEISASRCLVGLGADLLTGIKQAEENKDIKLEEKEAILSIIPVCIQTNLV